MTWRSSCPGFTKRLAQKATTWRRDAVGLLGRTLPLESQRVFALTVLLGTLCGFAAVAFHLAIEVVSRAAIDRALEAPGRSWMGWTLAVLAAGGVVSGLLLQYLFPNARGSGIPQVKAAYATRAGRLRLRDSLGKFLVSTLQIGTGSSLGREGPTVHITAGLAVWVGRLVRASPAVLRRLLPVGAAAGIAAAFNAPIAAVTFTIEEVVGGLDQTLLSGVIVAAAVAAVVERSVLGSHAVFEVPRGMGMESISSLLLYGLLGVLAAAISVAFTDSLLGLRARFRDMRRVPAWMRPALGAVATGVLAILARTWLDSGGVTGGGYATLGAALSGKVAVGVLVPLCLIKLAATVLSYSSGGAGGIFAPALFIGGMLGGAVGALDVALLDHSRASLGAFALVGMGAVFAGIIRAPITSVLIIIEMTDGYALILPLMIANMLAYGIARHYRPTPVYEALLQQDGVELRPRSLADAMAGVRVGDVPLDNRPFVAFQVATDLPTLLASLGGAGRQELFPVLDGDRLVGMITLADLVNLVSETHLDGPVNAGDVMRPAIQLRREDGLRTAFEAMLENGVRELPVTDSQERLLGFVDERSIAHACSAVRSERADLTKEGVVSG